VKKIGNYSNKIFLKRILPNNDYYNEKIWIKNI